MKLVDIKRITEELLNCLPEKSRNILMSRFGLHNDNVQTLEAIGKTLGITRERIRQIEVASFKALKKAKLTSETDLFMKKLEEQLREKGGFMDEDSFNDIIFGDNEPDTKQINRLKFILNSHKTLQYKKGSIRLSGIWYLAEECDNVLKLSEIHERVVKCIKKGNKLLKLDEVLKMVQNSETCSKEDAEFFEGDKGLVRLKVILKGSKLVNVNIIGQWGLVSWKMISQKGSREKAYLVYRKYKKPLHFRELTEYINKHWGDRKKALPQTVHNAIIMYDEFISIESGVYALREWDIFDEYVKEQVVELLTQEGKFIKIAEVIKYIATKKEVQDFTVQAILHDKELFIRRNDKYMLK